MQALRTSAAFAPTFTMTLAPDLSRVVELKEADRAETLAFLAARPVHTVVMTGFINDHGVESELHRGRFYGYRGESGRLEGVALIGHATLLEARTDAALQAFALAARHAETPVHLVMSDGDLAGSFWTYYAGGFRRPRLEATELLFEMSFPLAVRDRRYDLRPATRDELLEVAEAQAALAVLECGVDPMERDREGFMARVAERIDRGRVFVVVEDGRMIFKAEVMAEANGVAYLEGVFVAPERRGRGIGADCLAQLGQMLLGRVQTVCLLSNVEFTAAHASFRKAGFRRSEQWTTLFI